MRMFRTLMLVAMFAVSACSYGYVVQQDLTAYPFRHDAFDYRTAWRTSQVGSAILIDGVLKNVRYAYIDDLDLMIQVVGQDGTVRSRATVFPIPQHSRMDEVVPFSAKLPDVTLVPGDTLLFMLHYRGNEGGDGNDGIDWHSSFTVDAMSGAEIRQ
jgi:hypothetical protein